MKKKQKITIISSSIVLLVSIILNIIILCAPVFPGKYTYTDREGYKTTYTFYGNTYTYIDSEDSATFGFYYRYEKKLYFKSTEKSSFTSAKRNSVFSFSFSSNSTSSVKFRCNQAIFIQIGLLLIDFICIVYIITTIQNISESKVKQKIHKDMTESLNKINFHDSIKKDGE